MYTYLASLEVDMLRKKALLNFYLLVQLDVYSISGRHVGAAKNSTNMATPYVPVKSKLQHPPIPPPPGHTPGIWRLFLAREGGHLITTHMGWGIWSLASILCYESRWFPGDGRRQTLMNSKGKIAYSWRSGWKPKANTSFVPYLKVFKDDLCLIFFKWMARGM